MNFSEAMELLQHGMRLRRTNWPEKTYVEDCLEHPMRYTMEEYENSRTGARKHCKLGGPYKPSWLDREATNWEPYEGETEPGPILKRDAP